MIRSLLKKRAFILRAVFLKRHGDMGSFLIVGTPSLQTWRAPLVNLGSVNCPFYSCCDDAESTDTHCNTLQHIAAHCNTLLHIAIHCNTLQHAATHSNTLQHTVTVRQVICKNTYIVHTR